MKKVALINSFSDSGGAAKFTQTIFQELQKTSNYESNLFIQGNGIAQKCSRLQEKIFNMLSHKTRGFVWNNSIGFSTHSTTDLESYDLIHLNWIASQFYNLEALLSLGKPILWTAHDIWPITGGCHVYSGCRGFTKGCRKCPHVNFVGQSLFVSSNHNIKKKFLESSKLMVVAPSRCLEKVILDSHLISQDRVKVIPNPIDNIFFELKRKFPSSDNQKFKIGVVALGFARDKNKGAEVLLDALRLIDSQINYEFHVAGDEDFGSHFYHGILSTEKLAQFYQDMDLIVVPSRFESFGLVGLESLVSGTPIVIFDSTGASDYLIHKETGYIARNSDVQDLARGIEFCFENKAQLRRNIDTKVYTQYAANKISLMYFSLYNELLGLA